MAVDSSLAGRAFPATEPYTVSVEKLREFAAATGSDFDGGTAPATFPIVVAFQAMTALMQDPEVGIELHRVVHGEQRFTYTRPVVAGDTLRAALTVDSLRQIGGADIIGTRSEITDADGLPVCTAYATLVHRSPAEEPADADR
ncbi:FAS1-like dehydratase domain-containing protein [Nocardioides mesophilus]|uniref:MaoC family dehydratase N-terminal domain-containing protein n=1 Tax=Nocardioides mesophilus TaxID=433659 RepID=A0A7G9R6X2_9ACTN|nr:MaoC family dehydratase N-terminal domain-containing protein [Nocardioides mesophilus]QNN51347.1 MaoC family dehydratase N-terminal domain-containing protein [Nocardioides mesophilus]